MQVTFWTAKDGWMVLLLEENYKTSLPPPLRLPGRSENPGSGQGTGAEFNLARRQAIEHGTKLKPWLRLFVSTLASGSPNP